MSKNVILPKGMYWHYNQVSKQIVLIVEKDCEYRNVRIEVKR